MLLRRLLRSYPLRWWITIRIIRNWISFTRFCFNGYCWFCCSWSWIDCINGYWYWFNDCYWLLAWVLIGQEPNEGMLLGKIVVPVQSPVVKEQAQQSRMALEMILLLGAPGAK